MWIVFDIIVILIIALFAFIGYKQGLIKSLIKIVSFFIAVIVAFTLYKPVSKIIINNTTIDDNIKNSMVQTLNLSEKEEDKEKKGIIEEIKTKVVGSVENGVEEVAGILTIKIIEIITLILLFIVIRIILLIITLVTDLISKIPGIKQLNKTGGIIFGVIKGVIIVYIILAVVYLTTPMISSETIENINKSIITKTLYNNNIILNIFI